MREWHGYPLFVLPRAKTVDAVILRPIGYRRIRSPLSSKSDSWDLIEEAGLKARKERRADDETRRGKVKKRGKERIRNGNEEGGFG